MKEGKKATIQKAHAIYDTYIAEQSPKEVVLYTIVLDNRRKQPTVNDSSVMSFRKFRSIFTEVFSIIMKHKSCSQKLLSMDECDIGAVVFADNYRSCLQLRHVYFKF